MLTVETLKKHLSYDPASGEFTRIKWVNRGPAKARAGRTSLSTGYREIRVDGARYLAHRLAWLYIYEEWPRDCIDHINRVRDDNRICNLRESNPTENAANIAVQKNSSVGKKGIWLVGRKYRAHIMANGVRIHLGYFKTPELAAAAYAEAAAKHHGEFSCLDGPSATES